jgi:hypothetical protein
MFLTSFARRLSLAPRAFPAGRRRHLTRPTPTRLRVEECEARLLPNSLLAMSGLADLATGTTVADEAHPGK